MNKPLLQKLLLVAALLSFSGCVGKNDYFKSHESFNMDQTNNYVLVNDFIEFAQEYYNPATTKFVIDPTNEFSHFLGVLETRLRERGYGVSYATMNDAPWLAWKIDKADEETIMVTYHIADSKYTRFYRLQHNKYVPIGTFTIFNEKAKLALQEPQSIQSIVLEEPKEPMNIIAKEPSSLWDISVNERSYLHIRKSPTIHSKILGTLKKGTNIKTIPNSNNAHWAKLSKMDGYVCKRYLQHLEASDAAELIYAKQ